VKGTKQLKLDPSIYEAILKEKIIVGDVIYIEANTGAVKVCVNAERRFQEFKQYDFHSVWGALMHMHPRMILNQKHTYLSPRVMCTNEKNLCKM